MRKGITIVKANREFIKSLFPELDRVKDRESAEKAVDIWTFFWEQSNWEDVTDAAFSYEGTYLRLVQHTQSTVRGAIALADIIVENQHEVVDYDTLILGCVLHDVSKLVEYCGYDENGHAYKSPEGAAFQHSFLGAAKAQEMGMPLQVVKIILCHTPFTKCPMNCIEGLLLACADHASAHAANQKYDFK